MAATNRKTIQSIPPGELTVRKKSRTRYKIQKTKLQELETEVVVDSERTSCDDHEVPPSSPSTSTSENETLPELLNVEYLQDKLKKCRKIIQEQSTTIGNLKKINKKLEDKNNTLKNTIDFLLNHYESNTIGKHFLQNFD
ncbi:hypothetical protein RR46_11229 [Papilio xuthus]|uniref:Uncharacterized protein n=1 Tax=Papilio xuthus TaxID=66420 RepID=A0A194PYK5_PAPXU|nr:hypothetical protein RR46_11229 [Papilio xuthus]